jgi:hypothetical protein
MERKKERKEGRKKKNTTFWSFLCMHKHEDEYASWIEMPTAYIHTHLGVIK